MAKKIIAFILAAFTVFSFASCGKKEEKEDKDSKKSTTLATTAVEKSGDKTTSSEERTSDKTNVDEDEGNTGSTTPSSQSNTQKQGHETGDSTGWKYSYALPQPKKANTGVSWNLLLVNRDYILDDNFVNTISLVRVLEDSEEYLDSRVVPHYKEMFEAAAADGYYLTPCSGYRSYDLQKENFEELIDSYMSGGMSKKDATLEASETILPPGTSEHNAGLAMDIICLRTSFENDPEFAWLQSHAQDYGFILRYPKDKQDITKIVYEPWHWRYVGVDVAKKMKQSGQCLEEYLGVY